MDILDIIKQKKPLVHCITNFVTVNDCANIVLACNATPTMAHDIREVAEIAQKASSLVLNMGAIEDIEAMLVAGKSANEANVPIVLDPVAAGASAIRNESCARLLREIKLSVIRGNISEIKALANCGGNTRGVDAAESDLVNKDNLDTVCKMAQQLSKKTGAVIMISGETDIIADESRVTLVKNGCEQMTRITGSGCMLTALTGAFCGGAPNDIYAAAVLSAAAMGLCGEIAWDKTTEQKAGTASFRTYLIDAMSLLDDERLNGGKKIEVR